MKIAFIGGGNMGGTYARAFLRGSIIKKDNLLIIDKSPEKREEMEKVGFVNITDSITEEIQEYDIIFLSTKPQDFDKVVPDMKPHVQKHHLFISIMAGIKLKTMQKKLDHKKVIRAMPNTPSQLGYGVTGFAASSSVSSKMISTVDTLLEATGKSIFIQSEKQLDALTAVSGSGPAYFFYILKNMIQAGIDMGLDESVAGMLARETMVGSFHMMNNTDLTLDELMNSVMSKGGTTAAAVHHMMDCNVGENINAALKKARDRAEEISKEFD